MWGAQGSAATTPAMQLIKDYFNTSVAALAFSGPATELPVLSGARIQTTGGPRELQFPFNLQSAQSFFPKATNVSHREVGAELLSFTNPEWPEKLELLVKRVVQQFTKNPRKVQIQLCKLLIIFPNRTGLNIRSVGPNANAFLKLMIQLPCSARMKPSRVSLNGANATTCPGFAPEHQAKYQPSYMAYLHDTQCDLGQVTEGVACLLYYDILWNDPTPVPTATRKTSNFDSLKQGIETWAKDERSKQAKLFFGLKQPTKLLGFEELNDEDRTLYEGLCTINQALPEADQFNIYYGVMFCSMSQSLSFQFTNPPEPWNFLPEGNPRLADISPTSELFIPSPIAEFFDLAKVPHSFPFGGFLGGHYYDSDDSDCFDSDSDDGSSYFRFFMRPGHRMDTSEDVVYQLGPTGNLTVSGGSLNASAGAVNTSAGAVNTSGSGEALHGSTSSTTPAARVVPRGEILKAGSRNALLIILKKREFEYLLQVSKESAMNYILKESGLSYTTQKIESRLSALAEARVTSMVEKLLAPANHSRAQMCYFNVCKGVLFLARVLNNLTWYKSFFPVWAGYSTELENELLAACRDFGNKYEWMGVLENICQSLYKNSPAGLQNTFLHCIKVHNLQGYQPIKTLYFNLILPSVPHMGESNLVDTLEYLLAFGETERTKEFYQNIEKYHAGRLKNLLIPFVKTVLRYGKADDREVLAKFIKQELSTQSAQLRPPGYSIPHASFPQNPKVQEFLQSEEISKIIYVDGGIPNARKIATGVLRSMYNRPQGVLACTPQGKGKGAHIVIEKSELFLAQARNEYETAVKKVKQLHALYSICLDPTGESLPENQHDDDPMEDDQP